MKEMSLREGVTLYMAMMAAFKVLMMRYSGQTDISVGTPIANRSRVEVEGVIGLFANTLVMRTEVSGEASFKEVMRREREVSLGGYAHQEMPFEKLVEEVIGDSEKRIEELEMMSEEERREGIEEGKGSQREYPTERVIQELFEEQVGLRAEEVAVESEGEHLSYRELNERANEVAHYLMSKGVG